MKPSPFRLLPAVLGCLCLSRSAFAANHIVLMTNFAFIPGSIAVAAGDTLVWTNTTTTEHDTVANDGSWTSQLFGVGKTYETTLTGSGTYPYVCSIHVLEKMFGSVTVTNQAPRVSIVTPGSGAVYSAPATFVVEATASSAGGTITEVRVFEGTNLLGKAAGSACSCRVSGLTNGVYTFYAEAIDNATNSSLSAPVVATVTTVRLSSAQANPDGSFQFSVEGIVAGKTNLIEASSDLRIWFPVATNTQVFTGPAGAAFPFRFYRAVVEP
jgi:plastocyanin